LKFAFALLGVPFELLRLAVAQAFHGDGAAAQRTSEMRLPARDPQIA